MAMSAALRRAATLIAAVLAVLLAVSTPPGALAQSDCQGRLGDYYYDLSPLATYLASNVDVSPGDYSSFSYTYAYAVCGVVPGYCETADGMNETAVCERDFDAGIYRSCGDRSTAAFQPLPSGDLSAGFTLAFAGGAQGRQTFIEFFWYASDTSFLRGPQPFNSELTIHADAITVVRNVVGTASRTECTVGTTLSSSRRVPPAPTASDTGAYTHVR
jgi:hypothetical protein